MDSIAGNIGLPHIHHVKANIPNYNPQRCYNEVPVFLAAAPLTLRKSLKSPWLNLWDEQKQKRVGFRSIRRLPRMKKQISGINSPRCCAERRPRLAEGIRDGGRGSPANTSLSAIFLNHLFHIIKVGSMVKTKRSSTLITANQLIKRFN